MVDGSTTPLPCPFCGGHSLSSGGDDKFVGTRCMICEATGPNHYGRHDWNTRAALQSPPTGETGVGAKIIAGLQEAVRGDFTRITIEGQHWERTTPPPSPDRLSEVEREVVERFRRLRGDFKVAAAIIDRLSRQPEASDPVACDEARKLAEALREIPADLCWTEDRGNHRNLEIGKLAHQAVAALRASPVLPDREAVLLHTMQQECWTVRCVDIPTGGGDADVGWEVIQHHMAAPRERVIASGRTPVEALSNAMGAPR